MRIKVKKTAASDYIRRTYKGMRADCGMLHRPEWVKMLEAVQGKWIEVETNYLFQDQFNTVPIPGVSELGMRIMMESVEEIEDDVRIGLMKCGWCGKHTKNDKCDKCGKAEYLEKLV